MSINLSGFKITPRENPNNPNENSLLGTNGSAFVIKYNNLIDQLQLILNNLNRPIVRNRFSGDNITRSFLLSETPNPDNQVLVFVDNNYVNANNYSISGSQINFVSPPTPGANNVEVIILKY